MSEEGRGRDRSLCGLREWNERGLGDQALRDGQDPFGHGDRHEAGAGPVRALGDESDRPRHATRSGDHQHHTTAALVAAGVAPRPHARDVRTLHQQEIALHQVRGKADVGDLDETCMCSTGLEQQSRLRGAERDRRRGPDGRAVDCAGLAVHAGGIVEPPYPMLGKRRILAHDPHRRRIGGHFAQLAELTREQHSNMYYI